MNKLAAALLSVQLTHLATVHAFANEEENTNAGANIPLHDLQQENLSGDRLKEFLANPSEQSKRANIVGVVAHVGNPAVDWIKLGGSLRYDGKLDPVIRELAIVRVAVLMDSEYEVFYHDHYLSELGVAEEKIRAVREGAESDQFNDIEKAVLRLTDTVIAKYKPEDKEFQFLLNELGMQAFHELIFNIGYYMMTAVYMETFDVKVEEPPLYATQ